MTDINEEVVIRLLNEAHAPKASPEGLETLAKCLSWAAKNAPRQTVVIWKTSKADKRDSRAQAAAEELRRTLPEIIQAPGRQEYRI